MTVTCGFFDSVGGDRTYNADQMSRMFQGVFTDGIFMTVGGTLLVSAATGMTVNVASGRAWFNNIWVNNDATIQLTLSEAEIALKRIDSIILEVDKSQPVRGASIKILKGTPGSNPVAPSLSQSGTLFQYSLANIYVNMGVTSILTQNITNMVGTVGTPFITGIIASVDFATMNAQYQATFDAWFATVQDVLDENVAIDLQNQIDVLDGRIDTADTNISGLDTRVTSLESGSNPAGDWKVLQATLSYSSLDGATGVVNANANLTTTLRRGMRLQYKQSQSLIGYWPFDTDSGNVLGTISTVDTAMSYVSGKFGNGASFNGSTSKISITDTSVLKPTGDFTIGAWIKTALTTNETIFQSWSQNTNYAGFSLQLNGVSSSGVVRFVVGNNTGTTAQTVSILDGKTVVNDNQWHFVVATLKGYCMQIYVDGLLDAVMFGSFSAGYAATNYIRVGCSNASGSDSSYWSGMIDDLFMLNDYALDEFKIKDIFLSGNPTGSNPLTVTKCGIVTKVSNYSGGNTAVTFWGGTDFSLINAPITEPFYSTSKVPSGFNINPDKWTAAYRFGGGGSVNNPAANTYYNFTGMSFPVPIGLWDLSYAALSEVYYTAATSIKLTVTTTLSTTNNGESDSDFTYDQSFNAVASVAASYLGSTASRNKIVNLNSKTTYYLNASTDIATAASLHIFKYIIIRARCAYL